MKLKQTLFTIFAITLLSLGGWLTVIFNTDPSKIDTFILVALYCSLFLFIFGIATFIGFGIRILISKREVLYAHLPISIRQATLIALALVGLLFLQSLRVLSVVDAGALVLAILLLELYFRATPKRTAASQDTEEDL